jgi:two-component system response regulator HydG
VLAQYFLKQYSEKNRKRIKGFTPVAMDMLLKYDWPGNVRELENAVERAVILGPGDYMTEKELPLSITKAYPTRVRKQPQSLDEVEREAVIAALEASGGNKSETARVLGITRKTLHKKLQKYGVK